MLIIKKLLNDSTTCIKIAQTLLELLLKNFCKATMNFLLISML